MRYAIVLALMIVVAVGIVAADKQTELPSVEQVIAKHVEAIGGEQAYLKYDSRTLEGTMSLPTAGLSGVLTAVAMAPDKTLVEVTIEGLGTIREGFDGEVGWSTDPMSGPQLKRGQHLLQTKEQALYTSVLFPADQYKMREVVERVEFDGRPAWKIRFVSTNDNESFGYFDVDSGLQLGAELTQRTPMGDIPVRTSFRDYREFDGVMIPTRIEQDLGPAGTQIIEVAKVTSGGVDASRFALPAEIKALTEQ